MTFLFEFISIAIWEYFIVFVLCKIMELFLAPTMALLRKGIQPVSTQSLIHVFFLLRCKILSFPFPFEVYNLFYKCSLFSPNLYTWRLHIVTDTESGFPKECVLIVTQLSNVFRPVLYRKSLEDSTTDDTVGQKKHSKYLLCCTACLWKLCCKS